MQTPEILRYSHPLLTNIPRPVEAKDLPFIRWISMFMWHAITIDDFKGIGLSANQIGVRLNFFVADRKSLFGKDDKTKEPYVTICNPKPTEASRETIVQKEGCMSIPGVQVPIRRPKWLDVRYTDDHGQMQELRLEGLGARLFLHEYDHLEGQLILGKPAGVTGANELRKPHVKRKLAANASVAKEQLDEMGLNIHEEFLKKFKMANEKSEALFGKEA
jgi:peptide deformylase